jgi:hypothetical protein
MFGQTKRFKKDINVPMSAGQDLDGGLWFLATYPVNELFDISGHTPSYLRKLSDQLDQILFIEVYTDGQNRPYSGGCCIMDIFSYWPKYHWPDPAPVNRAKINLKIRAEWGLDKDEDHELKWRNLPMERATGTVRPAGVNTSPPVPLYRFTMDEEGMQVVGAPPPHEPRRGDVTYIPTTSQFRAQSWPRHARELIKAVVMRWMHQGGGDVDLSFGDVVYMGDQPLLDVANYFMQKGRVVW